MHNMERLVTFFSYVSTEPLKGYDDSKKKKKSWEEKIYFNAFAFYCVPGETLCLLSVFFLILPKRVLLSPVPQITFTKTFVQHYAFIMKTLMKSHESDTMSNRIVHISVQLFSNEELARHVTEECQLLDIMVTVLLYMMESCLIKSELQGNERNNV